MSKEDDVQHIIDQIQMIIDDSTVSKALKNKLQGIIDILENDEELPVRVNKALGELEGMSDEINMPSYTRTQLWNIAGMLESL